MSRKRRIAAPLLAGYVLLLLYWMFAGFGRTPDPGGPPLYNLVPLKTILHYLDPSARIGLMDRAVNLLGNVAVFIPVGLLLPVVWPALGRRGRFIPVFTAGIVLLELGQLLLRVGTFDVDDVILNLLGALTGWKLLQGGRGAVHRRNGRN